MYACAPSLERSAAALVTPQAVTSYTRAYKALKESTEAGRAAVCVRVRQVSAAHIDMIFNTEGGREGKEYGYIYGNSCAHGAPMQELAFVISSALC